MSTKIETDTVATVAYVLKNNKGEVLDQAGAEDGFEYLHGHQNIVPGLEQALTGAAVGDKLSVTVKAADAYGEYDAELVKAVPKEKFPEDIRTKVQPGELLQVDSGDGWAVVKVKEVSDTDITLDGNHELAGQDLHFDVEIIAIRPATAKEIEHGHTHADDDCCCGGDCDGDCDCDGEGDSKCGCGGDHECH